MTNNLKVVVSADMRETKSKEEHISDYIESLKAIEEAMEPYKEQKENSRKNNLTKMAFKKISHYLLSLTPFKDKVDIELDICKSLSKVMMMNRANEESWDSRKKPDLEKKIGFSIDLKECTNCTNPR